MCHFSHITWEHHAPKKKKKNHPINFTCIGVTYYNDSLTNLAQDTFYLFHRCSMIQYLTLYHILRLYLHYCPLPFMVTSKTLEPLMASSPHFDYYFNIFHRFQSIVQSTADSSIILSPGTFHFKSEFTLTLMAGAQCVIFFLCYILSLLAILLLFQICGFTVLTLVRLITGWLEKELTYTTWNLTLDLSQ